MKHKNRHSTITSLLNIRVSRSCQTHFNLDRFITILQRMKATQIQLTETTLEVYRRFFMGMNALLSADHLKRLLKHSVTPAPLFLPNLVSWNPNCLTEPLSMGQRIL